VRNNRQAHTITRSTKQMRFAGLPSGNKVCTWDYRFDLLNLLGATYICDENMRQEVLHDMSTSQYLSRTESPLDMSVIKRESFNQLRRRAERLVGSIPGPYRNAAAQRVITARFAWIPKRLSEFIGSGDGHTKILRHCDGLLSGDPAKHENDLISLIQGGALRSDEVMKTAVTGLILKSARMQKNKTKHTVSALANCDAAAINELGFALSVCASLESSAIPASLDGMC
jgi:hypothetical protein